MTASVENHTRVVQEAPLPRSRIRLVIGPVRTLAALVPPAWRRADRAQLATVHPLPSHATDARVVGAWAPTTYQAPGPHTQAEPPEVDA